MLLKLHFRFIILLMAIAAGGQQTAYSRVESAEGILQTTLLKKASQSPHTELKLVSEQVYPVSGHQQNKWNGSALPAGGVHRLTGRGLHNGTKSAYAFLLVKEYLYFIYPTHHFW